MNFSPMTIIILSFFVIFVIELILSANWVSWYFTVGIPVFRKQVRLEGGKRPMLDPTVLQKNFVNDDWLKLLFHSLDSNTVADREKLFNFDYFGRRRSTPVMHGFVRFDEAKNTVTITGNLNWTTLLMIPMFLFFPFYLFNSFIGFGFVIFLFVVLGYIYNTQARNYKLILDLIVG